MTRAAFDKIAEGLNEVSRSMSEEPDGSVIGYMCRIDWECELGAAADGNRVYPSVAAAKKAHPCWESCGIVEVAVRFRAMVHPGTEL